MKARSLTLVIAGTLLCATLQAQDLSGYRKFAFGADLPSIAKQAGLNPADAKTIYARPILIQDLDWQPRSSFTALPAELKSIKEVVFRFYDGALSGLSVTYDRDSTEGMTVEDMIEAVSVNFGTATKPVEEIIFPSIYAESVKVLARWEDAQYAFRLVRSSYPPTFGLVGISKRLDALTTAAIVQAKVIEVREAPQKEIERRRREEAASRVELEKVRLLNKSGFRP